MFKAIYKNDAMKRAEHEAVRKTAGWYFYTHQLIEVTGADAAAFLDYAYPKNIGNLAVSRARYTPMLNEQGIIRDDVVIFRMEENKFWISTLYARRSMAHLETLKNGKDVALADITSQYAMFAVQGPRSKDLINALVKNPVDEQKFFQILDNEICGEAVRINRGGFTGEKLGYEIYIAADKRFWLEEKLAEAAKAFDAKQVTEFQVMVLTLPTENGYFLMCDLEQSNPYEIPGFDKGINFDKDFVGKQALVKVQQEGPAYKLIGFTVADEDANIASRDKTGEGAPVTDENGNIIGYVTKFTYGYTAEKSIGFARLEAAYAVAGNTVHIADCANPADAVLCDVHFL